METPANIANYSKGNDANMHVRARLGITETYTPTTARTWLDMGQRQEDWWHSGQRVYLRTRHRHLFWSEKGINTNRVQKYI